MTPFDWVRALPTVNALLNSLTMVLLVLGYSAIRRGEREAHRRFMLSAVASSALFLTSYLIYHAQVGSVPFQGTGAVRIMYFALLIPHILLAAVMVPPILMVLSRAFRGEFPAHKKLARPTLALWLYVSVTGVLVYFMLYHL